MSEISRMCLVTGITGGLGRELAKALTQNDCADKYCFLYRNESKIGFVKELPGNIQVVKYDFTDHHIHLKHLELNKYRRISIILAAFDIMPICHLKDLPLEAVQRHFNINVLGQIRLLQEIINEINMEHTVVDIISIDSGATYEFIDGWGLYGCGKSYINKYLEQLSAENKFNLVLYSPGVMDTAMQEQIRSVSENDCSNVTLFREKYEKGNLRNPRYVAEDIVKRYIKVWTAKSIREQVSNIEMRDGHLGSVKR